MEELIKVTGLTKSYENSPAVSDLSFSVKKGEIVGLLGPNGAGKSTTINILATVLKPDSGNISICGYNLQNEKNKIKQSIGIVPQDLAIYEEISAEKNVSFFASLYGLRGQKLKERTAFALDLVGLTDKRKNKPKTFSGGMKRRLNIACAIAHDPQIIIMDEPTVGIDPQSRNHILESILKLKEHGVSILYSTHYMEEVEHIADRILVIDKGKQIAGRTLKELLQSYENRVIYFLELDGLHKNGLNEFDFLNNINGIQKVQIYKEMLKVTAQKNISLSELFSALSTHGYTIKNMSSETGSLETVFLELTGRNLRD